VIIGLSIATFTLVHVVITLIAILSGLVMLYGLLKSRRMDGLTDIFLIFTVLTDVMGFMFPFHGPHARVQSRDHLQRCPDSRTHRPLCLRSDGLVARHLCDRRGQAFQKIPALHALAPKGSESPFAIAQGLVLLFLVVTGFLRSGGFA
jgi:hypothetical protein